MSRALSVDLRARVVAAIESGMSCRQAALRFGVSAASAIRWRSLARRQGNVRPGPLGGDRRSGRIEGHAALILGLLDQKRDITLAELRAALAERGIAVGMATLRRFFERRQITLKKKSAHADEQTRPDVPALRSFLGPIPRWSGAKCAGGYASRIALEHVAQLGRRQGHRATLGLRPDEATAVQAFGVERHPQAIVPDDLDQRPGTASESARTDRRHGDRATGALEPAGPSQACPCACRYGPWRSRPALRSE